MIPSRRISPWWFASSLALLWAFYQVLDFLNRQWFVNVRVDQGPVPFIRAAWFTDFILIGLAVFTWLIRTRKPDRATSRFRQVIAAIALLIFFAMHAYSWRIAQHSARLWVEDVGQMTVAAIHDVAHGINPYTQNVNLQYPLDANENGYKYFPAMMGVYAPAVAFDPNGVRAILLTNFILSAIGALLLGICAAKWISPDAGLMCATLFFLSRLVSEELIQRGGNDIVPLDLAFCALLCLPYRFRCGLLVGLAVACKMLPGLLWVVLCVTPHRPRRFFLGVAAGLLPCVPFFPWNPAAFVRNTILFPLTRRPELSSLLYRAPLGVNTAAECLVALLWLAFLLRAMKQEIPQPQRCALAAVLTLCFELASPVLHQNYFIWW